MKTYKRVDLQDANGSSLNRVIRKDEKGLYVVKNARKGRLVKTVKVQMLDANTRYINVTRKVDYYEN